MGFLDRLAKFLGEKKKENSPTQVTPVPQGVPQSKPEVDTKYKTLTFDKGLEFVLASEGGYVNDQYDPGGETKYGISKKAYPHLKIASLTLDDARIIYYRDYWLGSGAKIEKYSPELAMILFDTAVNMGAGTAIRLLQRTLHVKEDGIFGEATQAALELSDIEQVIQWYMTIRVMRYSELETWPRYKRGWVKRVMGLMRYV